MNEKKSYQTINIVTVVGVLLLLLLSFLPTSPSWQYLGDNIYSGRPTYSLSFYYYFLEIGECFSIGEGIFIFCGVSMILFYVSLGVCFVSVLLKKDWLTLCSLLAAILSNILTISSLSNHVIVFSVLSLIICLVLIAINLVFNKVFIDIIKNFANKTKVKTMIQIGSNIKRERMNKNMTQEELAKRIYVSRTLITKFESGERMPSEDQIDSIAETLEISVDTLCSKR